MFRTDETFTDLLASARGVATAAGHSDNWIAQHREANPTPVEVELTLTVPMSIEDLAGALWSFLQDEPDGDVLDTLADAGAVRAIIVEALFASGSEGLEQGRATLAAIVAGTHEHERANWVRARVRELYAPASIPSQTRRAPAAA